MIRDLLYVIDIAEKSLYRVLLLLIIKSSKFHKAPSLESLFNKVAGLKAQLFSKETPTQVFSSEILKNIYEPLFLYLQVILFTMCRKYTGNEA